MRGRPTTAAVVAVSSRLSGSRVGPQRPIDPAPADEAPMEAGPMEGTDEEERRDRRSRCSRRNTASAAAVHGGWLEFNAWEEKRCLVVHNHQHQWWARSGPGLGEESA